MMNPIRKVIARAIIEGLKSPVDTEVAGTTPVTFTPMDPWKESPPRSTIAFAVYIPGA